MILIDQEGGRDMLTGLLFTVSLTLIAIGLSGLSIIQKRHSLRLRSIKETAMSKGTMVALRLVYFTVFIGLFVFAFAYPSAVAFEGFGSNPALFIIGMGASFLALIVSIDCVHRWTH